MKSIPRLIALLLVGLFALSGCSAMRSILTGGQAPAESSAVDVAEAPSTPRLTFYESWASW